MREAGEQARPPDSDSGFTRRDLLLAGGSALVTGAVVGAGGEWLLADHPEDDIHLWEAREQILNSVFFGHGGDAFLLDVVHDRVELPPGTHVNSFPSAEQNYWVAGLDGSSPDSATYDNDKVVLRKPMAVANPILLGADPFTDAATGGERWMLVDGPEGAGYVKCFEGDFQESKHKQVFIGPHWTGKGEDGMLRFSAKGFVFKVGGVGKGSLWVDMLDRKEPDPKKLAEGLAASEYIHLSSTITDC